MYFNKEGGGVVAQMFPVHLHTSEQQGVVCLEVNDAQVLLFLHEGSVGSVRDFFVNCSYSDGVLITLHGNMMSALNT